jgi:hypothetical protein
MANESTPDLIRLSAADAAFLRQLGRAIATAQTPEPVVYQVAATRRWVGADPDHADGMCLILGTSAVVFFPDQLAEAKEFLRQYDLDAAALAALATVDSLSALAAFCAAVGIDDYHYTGYADDEQRQGAFLTAASAARHVAAKLHHYVDPTIVAVPIRDNPELARLLALVARWATAGGTTDA